MPDPTPATGPGDTQDEHWMRTALDAAHHGLGLTAPNPPVGAAVVRGGQLLATGYHRRAGSPHAEVEALANAAPDARGATVYVTLEPCSTHGKTPPCCDALAAAGVARVVYGSADPNPAHTGRAATTLTPLGIAVTGGVLAAQTDDLIRGFSKRLQTGLPWLVAKAATSLDGRLARPPGEPRWLTGPKAREDAHHLRATVDAIVVGAGTVRADDPALTVRGAAAAAKPSKVQPLRAVLTRSGDLPSDAAVFTDPHRDRTVVYRNTPPRDVLADLAARGCNRVLVEGGGETIGAFFAAGLVDELVLYVAPLWCGGGPATAPLSGSLPIPASVTLTNPPTSTNLGADLRLVYRVRPA